MLNAANPVLVGLTANQVSIFATEWAMKHHGPTLRRVERAKKAVEITQKAAEAFMIHCMGLAPRSKVKEAKARRAAAKQAVETVD